MSGIKLGVNIDHVATLRNARGGAHPSVLRAAYEVKQAGADSITIHLREDRRHIKDEDVALLIQEAILPINLEMAATDEMVEIACRLRPFAVCIVPEKRAEQTTEGGLDVASQVKRLSSIIKKLKAEQIRVSLFIAPDEAQVQAAVDCGAHAIELHTGHYSQRQYGDQVEFEKIKQAAAAAAKLELEIHAGHGLNYDNVGKIASIQIYGQSKLWSITELNIGHFLIGEAIFTGLKSAICRMRELIKLGGNGIEGLVVERR